MKLLLYFQNIEYLNAVNLFLENNNEYNQRVILLESKADISEYPNCILLTDELNVYEESIQESKYILSEYESSDSNSIFKYQPFDEIVKKLFAENNLISSPNSDVSTRTITISSLYGGAGKSTVLYHISNYLNMNSSIAILKLFDSDAHADLANFILDIKYLDKKNSSWFYKKSYCKYILPSFKNINDYWEADLDDMFKYINIYLRSYNIKNLIIEIDSIKSKISQYIFSKSDLNIVVSNSSFKNTERTQTLEEEILYGNISGKPHFLLNNMDNSDTMMSLPFEDKLYEFNDNDFEIIQDSKFNLKLIRILKGVLNV